MKLSLKAGTTGMTINVFIQDSSSTVGAGLTGLVFNSAGLTAYYALKRSAPVAIVLATLALVTTAWASGGFKEIDAVNMPGWYRLDLPNLAVGAEVGGFVSIHLKGATNMAPLPIEIELTGWDNQDAVRGGMTAMPNAAAGAAGGLLISGSNLGTTTFAALSVTGATTYTGQVNFLDGIDIPIPTTANKAGLSITGNGTGSAVRMIGGSSGNGLWASSGATGGDGIRAESDGGSGSGIRGTGNVNGPGIVAAGGTSAHGLNATGGTTSGDGFRAVALAGNGDGIRAIGNVAGSGASFTGGTTGTGLWAVGSGTGHGIGALSGTGATGDGIRATSQATNGNGMALVKAGTGSDLLASLSGSVGSVVGAVGSVAGNVVGNVTGNVVGSVGSVTGNVVGSVGSVALDGITSASLAASAITEIQTGLALQATSTSILAVTDKINTMLESAPGSPGEFRYTADGLVNAPSGGLSAAGVRAAIGLASANLDTQLLTIDDFLDTEVAAIKAKTDLIPAAPAAVGNIPTALENADALLNRNMALVVDTNARTPLNAFRFIRNKWGISAGTLDVKKEDDTTSAWTAAVTGTAGANPVTGNDPA